MAIESAAPRAGRSAGSRPLSIPGEGRVPADVVALACVTGLLLNHSGLFGGFNSSLADPLLVLTLAALAVAHLLRAPLFLPVFFCIVLAVTLLTAGFVTPALFGVAPEGGRIASDAVKLLVSGLYVACGASIAAAGIGTRVLRWYAVGATVVAALGIAMQVSGATAFRDVLFYADLRFRGLMSDPNYWAVLTCAAVAFLVRDRAIRPAVRAPMIGVLTVAILLSGSKTGVIVLLAYATFALVEHLLRARRPTLATALLLGGVALAIAWDGIAAATSRLMQTYDQILPQLARLSALIDDPAGAVGGDGSGRIGTWEGGLEIIGASPVVGVGIGTYSSVNRAVTGSGNLAHNTYLQIVAEWGLPLALTFFAWLALLLLRASSRAASTVERLTERLMLRDMIGVFLVGSLSLSLNNARMFWLFVGMLAVSLAMESRSAQAAGVGSRDAPSGRGGDGGD